MEINNALITQWEPKINRMLQTTSIRGMEREDIAQELRIAILKAAKGFDPERKVSFHTYLHTTMVNTIRTLITKAQRRPQPQSLDAILRLWEMDDWRHSTNSAQKAIAVTIDMDTELMIKSMLNRLTLSNSERSFIMLRMENLTMDEISATLQESAYKVRSRIKQKLGGRTEQRVLLWLNGTVNL
jgi:RNA polymerase sigma factor (sigma-70 family)